MKTNSPSVKTQGGKETYQAGYDPNWKHNENMRRVREWVFWHTEMPLRSLFWSTLFFLHLARPVGRMMCRLNIYAKYTLSGRCQYCGEVHGIHWKIKELVTRKII